VPAPGVLSTRGACGGVVAHAGAVVLDGEHEHLALHVPRHGDGAPGGKRRDGVADRVLDERLEDQVGHERRAGVLVHVEAH
jgi:hypothetical protein